MSTPLSAAADLPADVETAFAALTGEQWPPALDARLRDGSRLVRRESTPDGGVVLVTTRQLPEGTPSALLKATRDGRVTQTDTWGPAVDGVRSGTWSVEVSGAPGTIGGTSRVEPTGAGSRWTVEGAVEIRLPLVGGKVERHVAPLVEKLVVTQAEVLRGLVTGAPPA